MDEDEYLCDCQVKWRKKVLSGCVFAAVVVAVMGLAIVTAFELHEMPLAKGLRVASIRVLLPAFINLAAVFAAHQIEKANSSSTVKNYACVFALLLVLASGAQLHERVYLVLLFPCLAISIAPPFGDMKLLNVTFAAALAASFLSCSFWAMKCNASNLVKVSVFVGVIGSCNVFYFFARSMLIALTEQMQFIAEGWKEQERLVMELKLEPLTRLYNRTAFQEAISAAMGDFRHFGHQPILAFIDLDNFKGINDNYGHASGDAVLIAFSELLTLSLGTNRNIFRYGGDEFAVLFKDVTIEEVKITMETIRVRYAMMKFDFINEEASVSASIGIACYRKGMTSKEWITAADDAAYAAKSAGKNNVVASKV